MKKCIIPFLLSFILLFSSCTTQHPEMTIPTLPFESTVTIVTEDGEETEVYFSMTDDQNGCYRILSPESIAGTVFSYQNGVYTGSIGGISIEYLPDFLPDKGVLFDIFSLQAEPLQYAITENGVRYSVQSYIEGERNFLFFFREGVLIKLVVEGDTPLTLYFLKEQAQ